MVWDKSRPSGNTRLSNADNLHREQNDALEAALDLEHGFATGGTQTGRHAFDVDTVAARDAAAVAYEDGGIFFATDVRTGRSVLQVRVGGVWESVDIDPGDLPRTDEQSRFTTCQFGEWETITAPGGQATIDLAESARKTLTLTEDTEILNPVNGIAGHATTVLLDVVQGGIGDFSVTWGNAYRAVGGAIQIATPVGARTAVALTAMPNGQYWVNAAPNWGVEIT